MPSQRHIIGECATKEGRKSINFFNRG